jgi:hypothetical protein
MTKRSMILLNPVSLVVFASSHTGGGRSSLGMSWIVPYPVTITEGPPVVNECTQKVFIHITPISAFAVYERCPVCQGQEDATSLQIMPGAGHPQTHPRAVPDAYVSPVCRNQVRGEERPVTDIDKDLASAKEINTLALGTIKLSTVLPSFSSAATQIWNVISLLAPRAGLTFFYSFYPLKAGTRLHRGQ